MERDMDICGTVNSGFQPLLSFGISYPEAYAVGLDYKGLSVLHQNVPTNKLNCNRKHKVRVEDPYYFSPMRSETERRVKEYMKTEGCKPDI